MVLTLLHALCGPRPVRLCVGQVRGEVRRARWGAMGRRAERLPCGAFPRARARGKRRTSRTGRGKSKKRGTPCLRERPILPIFRKMGPKTIRTVQNDCWRRVEHSYLCLPTGGTLGFQKPVGVSMLGEKQWCMRGAQAASLHGWRTNLEGLSNSR